MRILLPTSLVRDIVALADTMSSPKGFTETVLLNWEFLFRVQSECIPLLASSRVVELSEDIPYHSAVYANNGVLIGLMHC